MWTDPVFCPAVTTLVVVGLKASWLADSPIGTFEQFLDALKAMAPSLVNLTLDESVPRLQSHTTDPPLTHGRSITLSSLQTLRILCNTNDCVHLMDHLTVNPAATMDLTGNRGAGIERLVEILSAHISRSTPLLGLKIFLPRSTSEVTIAGYKDPDLGRLGFDDLGAINLALSTSLAGERPLTAVLRAAGTLFSRSRPCPYFRNNATTLPGTAFSRARLPWRPLSLSGIQVKASSRHSATWGMCETGSHGLRRSLSSDYVS